MTRVNAYGVALDLPGEWEDRSIHQFVASSPAVSADGTVPSGAAPMRTSITLTDLGTAPLDRAVAGLSLPALEDVTVLRAEHRESDSGPFFERVIRFADPDRGGAVQQSLRLLEASGRVFALGFTARPSDFNESYRLFAKFTEQFAQSKRDRTP